MASRNWHLRQLYGQNDCKMLNLNLAWLLFCDASVFSEVGYVVIQPLWQKRKASSLVTTWLFPEHINLLSLKWLFLNPFIRGLACKARSTGFKRWLENKHKLFELGEHSDTPLSKLRVTKNPKDVRRKNLFFCAYTIKTLIRILPCKMMNKRHTNLALSW